MYTITIAVKIFPEGKKVGTSILEISEIHHCIFTDEHKNVVSYNKSIKGTWWKLLGLKSDGSYPGNVLVGGKFMLPVEDISDFYKTDIFVGADFGRINLDDYVLLSVKEEN